MNKQIIGMVDGVFDLLHTGHIRHLNACREHCDFLIVAIADDEFAKRKGEDRPYIKQADRLLSIQSLKAVDLAFLCNGSVDIVNQIHPDVYFKNWDYKLDPGLDKSINLKRMDVYGSTTELVKQIKGAK